MPMNLDGRNLVLLPLAVWVLLCTVAVSQETEATKDTPQFPPTSPSAGESFFVPAPIPVEASPAVGDAGLSTTTEQSRLSQGSQSLNSDSGPITPSDANSAQELEELPSASESSPAFKFRLTGSPGKPTPTVLGTAVSGSAGARESRTAGRVNPARASPEMIAWLTRMIYDNLPETYEDDRKWGKQKEVWNGIRLRREGLRIETKRRKKMVNAGTWTRYRVKIVDPDQHLSVNFNRLEALPDGRVAFSVTSECLLDVFGRLSQWVRDVQLISLSANADAACRFVVDGTVSSELDFRKFPPDVRIKPVVHHANVDVTHFRVRRISQVGGDFAKILGEGLEEILDEKIDDFNSKLVDKINRQINKKSDRLKFSMHDWLKTKLPIPNSRPADTGR